MADHAIVVTNGLWPLPSTGLLRRSRDDISWLQCGVMMTAMKRSLFQGSGEMIDQARRKRLPRVTYRVRTVQIALCNSVWLSLCTAMMRYLLRQSHTVC